MLRSFSTIGGVQNERDDTRELRVIHPLRDFLSTEAASGVVLVLAIGVALVWANARTASYEDFWTSTFTIGFTDHHLSLTLREWVNDGLMAVFFFVVGLEIKRELVEGELREPRKAALPVVAALGGMAVPALVYVAFNAGGRGSDGWGVPMATDIAIALGVLALLGRRVAPPTQALPARARDRRRHRRHHRDRALLLGVVRMGARAGRDRR